MRLCARLLALVVGSAALWSTSAGATPLIEAIKNADKPGVEALIAKGANVNEKQDGLSPLGVSLGAKEINAADIAAGRAGVKDRGADFDAITKLLLDHGADANAPVQNGSYDELAPMFGALGMGPTPLNWSIWSIDPSSVALLAAHGVPVHQNTLGLLEFAAIAREGGDHPYTQKFYTDLDAQISRIAALLIAKGAHFSATISAHGTVREQVALLGFAQALCVETVKLLVDRGADVNAMVQMGEAKVKLLKAVEDTYAKENIDRKDIGFSRDVWDMIKARQVAVMQFLIARGATE